MPFYPWQVTKMCAFRKNNYATQKMLFTYIFCFVSFHFFYCCCKSGVGLVQHFKYFVSSETLCAAKCFSKHLQMALGSAGVACVYMHA